MQRMKKVRKSNVLDYYWDIRVGIESDLPTTCYEFTLLSINDLKSHINMKHINIILP